MRRAIKPANKAQAEYQDRARALGCVVCLRMGWAQPNETHIHHRNIGDLHGQKQIGQHAVVAMCAYHHEGIPKPPFQVEQMRDMWGPSFKAHARDFREWTQDQLPGYPRGTEGWQQFQNECLGVSENGD